MATATPTDLDTCDDTGHENAIEALRIALPGMSVADRARAVMAPELIAAAAAVHEADPDLAALVAEMRRLRVESAAWKRAVSTARREAAADERRREHEARRRTVDPSTLAGKIAAISADLICDQSNKPLANHHNIAVILSRDPRWAGVIAHHVLRETVVTTRVPEWGRDLAPSGARPGEWTDNDTTRLAAWLGREWGIDAKTSMIGEAVNAQAERRRIDPIRDYLEGLPRWDGIPRLDTWTIDHLGAADTTYTRAVSSRWMISAVARIYEPGCKVDCLPVFGGSQSPGKSSALRALCPDRAWFAEIRFTGTKDDEQSLRGKWILEMGELSGIAKSEIERFKAFVTCEIDSYRPSYGRRFQDFPRRSVLAGTTNDDAYLRDVTGNRRIWPLDVGDVDRQGVVAGIEANRDQLWAEARYRYLAGEAWHVDTPELAALCASEQENHRRADPWEAQIARYLEGKDQTLISEVLSRVFSIEPKDHDMPRVDRVRLALRAIGWTSGRGARQIRTASAAFPAGKERAYYPPAKPAAAPAPAPAPAAIPDPSCRAIEPATAPALPQVPQVPEVLPMAEPARRVDPISEVLGFIGEPDYYQGDDYEREASPDYYQPPAAE